MSDEEGQSTDFSEDEIEDDDEATMAEEEELNGEDADELRLLEEENELSIEELRRRYYGDAAPAAAATSAQEGASSSGLSDQPSSSSSSAAVVVQKVAVTKDYFEGMGEDDEEDADYVPKADLDLYWKKDVRIGDNYQVSIPLPAAKPAPATVDYRPPGDCSPLWRPKRTDEKAARVQEFLAQVAKRNFETERKTNGSEDEEVQPQANRPAKSTAVADDEDALFALFSNDYDVERTLKQMPFERANGPRVTGPKEWKPMSPAEVAAFEASFRQHGKNFFMIQRIDMPHRSMGELIYFYYVWKKTERHDMFVNENRALGLVDIKEKTIDPMDTLVDQQLGEVNGLVLPHAAAAFGGHHSAAQHRNYLSVPHAPPAAAGVASASSSQSAQQPSASSSAQEPK